MSDSTDPLYKRSKTDHIRVESGSMRLFCQHCGQDYQPGMPAPINIYLAAAKEFGKIHRKCRKT